MLSHCRQWHRNCVVLSYFCNPKGSIHSFYITKCKSMEYDLADVTRHITALKYSPENGERHLLLKNHAFQSNELFKKEKYC